MSRLGLALVLLFMLVSCETLIHPQTGETVQVPTQELGEATKTFGHAVSAVPNPVAWALGPIIVGIGGALTTWRQRKKAQLAESEIITAADVLVRVANEGNGIIDTNKFGVKNVLRTMGPKMSEAINDAQDNERRLTPVPSPGPST
jgi:hypothetical protein